MNTSELLQKYDKECLKTNKFNTKLKKANMFTFWYYSLRIAESYVKRNELLFKAHDTDEYRKHINDLKRA